MPSQSSPTSSLVCPAPIDPLLPYHLDTAKAPLRVACCPSTTPRTPFHWPICSSLVRASRPYGTTLSSSARPARSSSPVHACIPPPSPHCSHARPSSSNCPSHRIAPFASTPHTCLLSIDAVSRTPPSLLFGTPPRTNSRPSKSPCLFHEAHLSASPPHSVPPLDFQKLRAHERGCWPIRPHKNTGVDWQICPFPKQHLPATLPCTGSHQPMSECLSPPSCQNAPHRRKWNRPGNEQPHVGSPQKARLQWVPVQSDRTQKKPQQPPHPPFPPSSTVVPFPQDDEFLTLGPGGS